MPRVSLRTGSSNQSPAGFHSSLVHRYIDRRDGILNRQLPTSLTSCERKTYCRNIWHRRRRSQLMRGCRYSVGRSLCRKSTWPGRRRRSCRLQRSCSRWCWGGPFWWLLMYDVRLRGRSRRSNDKIRQSQMKIRNN